MRMIGAMVIALALVAAACSGAADTTTTAGRVGSGDGETLSDFIPGMPSFDPSDQAAALAESRRQEQRVQELVAQCMADQGFEYIPYVPNQDAFGSFDEADYVSEFGFGLATQILIDESEMERRFEEEMAQDPNRAIVEAMNPQEQQAYDTALYGEPPDIDPETMSEDEIDAYFQDYVPSGCMAEAQNEVYNQGAAEEFFRQFGDALDEQFRSIESDPRIQGLEERWAACMKDKGYDVTKRTDPELSIVRRLEAIGVVTDLEVGPEGELMGYGMEAVEPDDPRRSQIQAIADEEIALATASYECSKEFADVYQEVQQEYEQKFIEQHRAELERFRQEHSGG